MRISALSSILARALSIALFFFLFLLTFATITEFSARVDVLLFYDAEIKLLNEQRVQLAALARLDTSESDYDNLKSDIRKNERKIKKLIDIRRKIIILNDIGAPNRTYTIRRILAEDLPLPSFSSSALSLGDYVNDPEASLVVKRDADGQASLQQNPHQLPQRDSFETLANLFRFIHVDIQGMSINSITILLLVTCSWIGYLAVSFKKSSEISLDALVYVTSIGIFLYLAVKGGGILLIFNPEQKNIQFNPYGLALLSMFMGAYSEAAYALFQSAFDKISSIDTKMTQR